MILERTFQLDNKKNSNSDDTINEDGLFFIYMTIIEDETFQ